MTGDPLLQLLDSLPDAVLVTAADAIIWAGGAVAELTGEDLRGRAISSLCTTASRSALERLEAAAARGEVADARILWQRADGRVVPLSVRVLPLPGDDGRVAWLARPDAGRLLACVDEAMYSCVLGDAAAVELVYASPRFELLVGQPPEDMTPVEAWRARIHPDDRERVRAGLDELRAGRASELEYRLRCADGSERVVLDRANPHPPEDGTVTIDGILIDITERRQTARAFAETSSRLAHVIESIDEYLYTDLAGVDGHLGRAVYASPGIYRVLGRTVPLAELNPAWEAAVHPDDVAVFRASHERMAAGESFEVEYRIVRPDGDVRWVFDRARPRRTTDRRVLIDGVIADVTERHRVADELAAARAKARVGLLIADVDHFKRVNDTYGHLAGDRVLAEIAERLAAAVRRYDTLARFGGEEFVVLVPDVQDLSALVATGEQLCEAIRAHPFGMGLTMTVSIGAALAEPGDGADSLIGAADEALYAAKDAGRDCVRSAPRGASLRAAR